MAEIRAILFDFGGTLDLPGHWLDRFLIHYRAAGFDISRHELDRAFSAAIRQAYSSSNDLRTYGFEELVHFLVGEQLAELIRTGPPAIRAGLGAKSDAELGAVMSRIVAPFVDESLRGLAHSRRVLIGLAPRYKLGVVSNFYGNLDRVLADSGIASLMAAVIDSSRVDLWKPDPRIYQAGIDALGIPPSAVAMVGDSIDKDCVPARSLGLTTVWLRTQDKVAAAGCVDHYINRLEELSEIRW